METLIIFGAKYLVAIFPLTFLVYALRAPRGEQKRIALFFLLSIPLTFLLSFVADQLYHNPRPFVVGGFEPLIPHSADNGFPSNHALWSSAIASGLYFFHKRIGLWLGLAVLVVSASRVLADIHHSIDVLAGVLIALLVAWLVNVFLKKRGGIMPE